MCEKGERGRARERERREIEGGENTALSSNRLFVLSTTLLKPLSKSCLSQSPRPKKHQKANGRNDYRANCSKMLAAVEVES